MDKRNGIYMCILSLISLCCCYDREKRFGDAFEKYVSRLSMDCAKGINRSGTRVDDFNPDNLIKTINSSSELKDYIFSDFSLDSNNFLDTWSLYYDIEEKKHGVGFLKEYGVHFSDTVRLYFSFIHLPYPNNSLINIHITHYKRHSYNTFVGETVPFLQGRIKIKDR